MSQPNPQSNVSTPLVFRWRRACSQFLPLTFFVLLCVACLLLWQFQNRSIVQVGEVEAISYEVASPATGIVAGWSTPTGERMTVYSSVTEDQIIMELDDESVVQDLQTIRRQLNDIKNRTQSKIATLDENDSGEYLVSNISGPRAEENVSADTASSPWQKLARCAGQALQANEISQLQLKLRKLDSQIRAVQISELPTDDRTALSVSLNQKRREVIAEMEAIRIELATSEAVSATDLATANVADFSDAERMFFQSATQRCEMLEQQIDDLKSLASRLDIRSPINGQIEKSLVNRYDAVAVGEPVVSIAPTEGKVVVVYARETGPVRPFAGMPVVLASRSNRLLRAETIVSSVGPKIESIPPRQRTNPRVEEWGRPMRIEIPKSFVIEPGALVNVTVDLNRPSR